MASPRKAHRHKWLQTAWTLTKTTTRRQPWLTRSPQGAQEHRQARLGDLTAARSIPKVAEDTRITSTEYQILEMQKAFELSSRI